MSLYSLFRRIAEGALNENPSFACVPQEFNLMFEGWFRNENAYPEYDVPTSMATTTRLRVLALVWIPNICFEEDEGDGAVKIIYKHKGLCCN